VHLLISERSEQCERQEGTSHTVTRW